MIIMAPKRQHTNPIFTELRLLKIKLRLIKIEEIMTFQIGVSMYRYDLGLLPSSFKGFLSTGSDLHTYFTRSLKLYSPTHAHTKTHYFSIKSTGAVI